MTLPAPGLVGPLTASTPYADPLLAGAALRHAHAIGLLDLPLPGGGQTLHRWEGLAGLARLDASLGRLAEGHADALAILAELGGPDAGDRLWGVWAAEPPTARVSAVLRRGTWRLTGRKAWCSGALVIGRALVTAHAPDGRRLFAVRVADAEVDETSWPAVGMAGSGSYTVELAGVPAEPVGVVDAYLTRPGFWHGGIGVAACWYGIACGTADALLRSASQRDPDAHVLAHLGAVDAVLGGLRDQLAQAAAQVDADPADAKGQAEHLARRVRARVEAGATEVLDRVGRALGAGPLCQSATHAQRAADLPVYLRQSHAERDLADLGRLAVRDPSW